jgi:ribosomal protein L37E
MAEKNKPEQKHLRCPFCDDEIAELQYPYCAACKVEIARCPECGKSISVETKTCPKCGASLNAK